MKSDYEWHVSLNKYNQVGDDSFRHWMYEAKRLYSEIPRLPILFKRERKGELNKVHKQCSFSEEQEVTDNHLTCCLGIECRKCPHLLALENAKAPPDDIDEIKAFTCISHILHESGKGHIDTSEGYILTTDDRMYWQNVYESMSNYQINKETGK